MADLEAVLADVSYLMAMEKSKCTPAARASKKIILPDPRYALLTATRFPAALRYGSIRGGRRRGGGRGGGGGGGGGSSIRLSARPLEDLSPFPAPPFFRLFSILFPPPPSPTRRLPSREPRARNKYNVYKQNRA